MKFETYSTKAEVSSLYDIQVRFKDGLTLQQRRAFQDAANRWSRVIVGNLPKIRVNGEIVDDVLILAGGAAIDGRGGILGQAGPTHLRPETLLPARGIMSFDIADLADMEKKSTLGDVITHEMGHVLGIGTIWSRKGFLKGAGSNDPVFTGANAVREYTALRGVDKNTLVPVANTGGPGTRDAHWREVVFGNELMSGFITQRDNPISKVTVGSLEDIGYKVNYDAAEPYSLPTNFELVEMGFISEFRERDHGGHGMMFIPDQEVLPKDSLV